MKFKHPEDTKTFIIGVASGIAAVILWDIIKKRAKIFNYKADKLDE